jgi:hypothetical protein
MAFSVTPLVGIDLTNTVTAASIVLGAPVNQLLGLQVFGSDGRRYVFAKAGDSIGASDTTCSVDATTFVASNVGGTYDSPAYAMVVGDYGWFSEASV